jgi:hypothetical protein
MLEFLMSGPPHGDAATGPPLGDAAATERGMGMRRLHLSCRKGIQYLIFSHHPESPWRCFGAEFSQLTVRWGANCAKAVGFSGGR